MSKPLKHLFFVLFVVLFIAGCKKQLQQENNTAVSNSLQEPKIPTNFFVEDNIIPGVANSNINGSSQAKDSDPLPDNGD